MGRENDLSTDFRIERGKGEKYGGRQGKQTRKAQRKAEKEAQLINALGERENGEQTPVEEINSVLSSLMRRDSNDLDLTETKNYITWLTARLIEKELDFSKEKFGDFEKITPSVGAGGAGRQTSRNSRARTHLITGIREKSEKDRKSYPNEIKVMEKLKKSLERHIDNWRAVLKTDPRFSKNYVLLDEKILEMMAELEKK